MKAKTITLCVATLISCCTSLSMGNEPQWTGIVIARGHMREHIESTPMLHRPYRPFHFYGNTLRRQYYRGWPTPVPRDIVDGARVLVLRR